MSAMKKYKEHLSSFSRNRTNSSTYLYGMSLRLDWLCEWVTLAVEVLDTPQMASSWAEPDKLRSLPRRRPSEGWGTCCCCCCCTRAEVGAEVAVDDFFFTGPPNPKNLSTNERNKTWKRLYPKEKVRLTAPRQSSNLFLWEGCTPAASRFL